MLLSRILGFYDGMSPYDNIINIISIQYINSNQSFDNSVHPCSVINLGCKINSSLQIKY